MLRDDDFFPRDFAKSRKTNEKMQTTLDANGPHVDQAI
jgi:hypothetical protein